MEVYYIENGNQFFAGNGQPVREELIRSAVEHCRDYATDICVLLSPHNDTLIEWLAVGGTLTVGFRELGIEWTLLPVLPGGRTYKHISRLVKLGNNVTLYR